ncbi:putative pentatricopeptide [Rosa chinensis]|uniref:Putative pentatricopeptide n=1 Tax=Rosa chinensis TaxID=74649 RepID=A0A2P6PGU2_ROSCH|nr:uncharacterized protein LOC121050711 [Rosa chinensis]PRQ21151.1 putative pentatricopeptide [Rosa chinensis]
MAETSSPNSSADDLKNHVMKIFQEATKDCEDECLKAVFCTIGRSYDSLNDFSIKLFNSMADTGIIDRAREMFKPVSDLGILSPVAVFTIVIMTYAGNHKAKSALKVYQQMIATGINPACYTYVQLICVLATDFSNVKFLRYAKKYFLEMLDKGMKPNPTPFWKIMEAIAYREPVEKAKEFLEQIKAKGFMPPDSGFHYKEAYLAEGMQTLKMYANLVHNDTIDEDVRKYFFVLRACPGYAEKLGSKMYSALVDDGNVDEYCPFHLEAVMLWFMDVIPASFRIRGLQIWRS